MSELDKVYCVFGYDNWGNDEIMEDTNIFFFSKEAAEAYAHLCNLQDQFFNHRIVELECHDHMLEDYKIFIRNLEEEKKLKYEAERIREKKSDIRQYARLKAKLERGNSLDFIDIEKELLKKHGLE